MALRIRRRWVFLLGGFVLLTVLVYGTARFADEPLRRYMEAEVNRRLTGYTVQITALRVHPWTASVELHDATIAQDANPDPPVAQVARLVTRIDWRALLHRRVVADISFERPTVYLNLKQVRTEASESTALKDRGWQQALEALAFDLKINRLRVVDGDITYVDQGPFKPLHVSRVNLGAENIRNIASKGQVYPSPILLEAVVFDVGAVWLDGRANFLAEPHVGVQAALRLDQVALDYFKPITNRYNLAVRNGSLSLAGSVEYAPKITRLILERVLVEGVALEYLHLPHTAEAEKIRAQQTAQAAKEATRTSTELRIERLEVVKSTFGFMNQAAKPAYRLQLTDTNLTLEHLGNQGRDGPAVARLTGQLMGRGETRLTVSLQPQAGSADMDQGGRVFGVLGTANEGRRYRRIRQAAVPGGRDRHRRRGGSREGAPPAALRGPGRDRREGLEKPPAGRGRDRGADLRASGPSGGGSVGDGGPPAAERLPQADRAGVRAGAESERWPANFRPGFRGSRPPGA